MAKPHVTLSYLDGTHVTVTVSTSQTFNLRMFTAMRLLELACWVMPCSGTVTVGGE